MAWNENPRMSQKPVNVSVETKKHPGPGYMTDSREHGGLWVFFLSRV